MSKPSIPTRDQQQAEQQQEPKRTTQQPDSVEDDPAVDRGERIATGKGIARGGHESGNVPGAVEQSADSTTRKPRQ